MIHNMMIAAATTEEVSQEVSQLCGGGNVYVFAIIVLLIAVVFAVLRIAMSVSKLPTEQSQQKLNDAIIAELQKNREGLASLAKDVQELKNK
jgi:cell division protein FtsL